MAPGGGHVQTAGWAICTGETKDWYRLALLSSASLAYTNCCYGTDLEHVHGTTAQQMNSMTATHHAGD